MCLANRLVTVGECYISNGNESLQLRTHEFTTFDAAHNENMTCVTSRAELKSLLSRELAEKMLEMFIDLWILSFRKVCAGRLFQQVCAY